MSLSDLMSVDAPPWMRRAACAAPGIDPEIFFPPRGENGTAAKQVCRRCPVALECRERAWANRENHGVWGGRSARSRLAS